MSCDGRRAWGFAGRYEPILADSTLEIGRTRSPEAGVTFLRNLVEEPWRFDYFSVLRHLERSSKDRPRIGDSASRRDEYVSLGQDPYMDFPASNLARVEQDEAKPLKVFVKFLGMLGPQGALPLATTEEAYHWLLDRDDAFARFLDIFNNRFIQLFFRAWADSRPIAQHDRPDADRFLDYVGSMIGTGSAIFRGLDSIPDATRAGFAGLIGAQAKSASRLADWIRGMFRVEAEVEEFVGSRLMFEPTEWTILCVRYTTLGEDTLVGRGVFSVQDKIREKKFLQGLIQVAVAFHHHSTGNLVGARSLLGRARKNLAGYPEGFLGIRVAGLLESLAKWQAVLASGGSKPAFPQLDLTE